MFCHKERQRFVFVCCSSSSPKTAAAAVVRRKGVVVGRPVDKLLLCLLYGEEGAVEVVDGK